MLRPVLAHLMALALVDDSAVGTWDYTPRWRVSQYGFRFLNFLPVDRTLFDTAVVVCSWHSTVLRVRNLGWGSATVRSVDASWDSHSLRPDFPADFRLTAGQLLEIPVDDEVPRGSVVRMTAEWSNPDGQAGRFEGMKTKGS